jgi:glycosyltransferase involved in cell wall biosynthesis
MIGEEATRPLPHTGSKGDLVFIVGQLGRGGAERQLFALLASTALPAMVISLDRGGYWADRIRSLGYRVIEVERSRHFEWRRLREVVRLVRAERPTVVCIWLDGVGSLYGRLAAIVCRPRFTVVGLRSHPRLFPVWYRALLPVFNLFASRVVANSNAARDYAVSRGLVRRSRIAVIPNGIDIDEFVRAAGADKPLGEWADNPIVGTVTRLDERKDTATFVRMAAEVWEQDRRARFVIVGDGPLRARLEDLSRELGLSQVLVFLGEVEDIAPVVARMDVFVLTSSSEGLPNVIMEAMALETPSVATNVGDVRRLIVEGETGYLAAPGDYRSLARHVSMILSDDALSKELGRRACAHVRAAFSETAMVGAWTATFDRLLSGVG